MTAGELGFDFATGTVDKLRLGGIEELVAMAVLWDRTFCQGPRM